MENEGLRKASDRSVIGPELSMEASRRGKRGKEGEMGISGKLQQFSKGNARR